MSWMNRVLDHVRRSERPRTSLPTEVLRAGMDRFREQSAAQLLDTSMRVGNDDPLMGAICSALRRQKAIAINNITQAHRMRVSDGELRTIVGELVGITDFENVLMEWVDNGRREAERASKRQRG